MISCFLSACVCIFDMRRPFVLMILDGWGVAPASRGNAITSASTPAFDSFIQTYVTTTVQAAGEAVGLPWSEQGNSEVGHTNIGAGRVVYQDLQRINQSIEDGSFFENKAILTALSWAKEHSSAVHIIGLLSNGGVHGSLDHVITLVDFADRVGVGQIWVHGILDGRDTPFNSGVHYVKTLLEHCKSNPRVELSTLIGRFYAMDRDNHWDRIQNAHELIGLARGVGVNDVLSGLEQQYASGVFDEYMPALVHRSYQGIKPNDVVIFANFRSDRARQLTRSFAVPDFEQFKRTLEPPKVFVTMTEYEKGLPVDVAFMLGNVVHPLCEVVADAGLSQFHIAETEKYAHVTYFLNGGREEPFERQTNVMIPSRQVVSHDEHPEMMASEITERVVKDIQGTTHDVYIMNYANADMVAHTGNLSATIEAIEVLDRCMKDVVEATLSRDGVVLITADHGNAEELIKAQTGEIDKEHSTTPVPVIVIGREFRLPQERSDSGRPDLSKLVPSGVLADIAPTILKILGLQKPKEMTGRSLV